MQERGVKRGGPEFTSIEGEVWLYIIEWKEEFRSTPSSRTMANHFGLSRNQVDKVRKSIQKKLNLKPRTV